MSANIEDYLYVETKPDRFAIMAKTSHGEAYEVCSVGKEEQDAEQTANRKWLMLSQMVISYARGVMGVNPRPIQQTVLFEV